MASYLMHWLCASTALILTAYLVPGFHIEGFFAALLAAVIVGLVNIFIWPVLLLLTLPLTIFTFGFFLLIVNGLTLKIAAALTPGFSIDGFFPAVIGSIILTIIGWLIRFVFYSDGVSV